MSDPGEKAPVAEAEIADPEGLKETPTAKDDKKPEKQPTPPFSNYLVGIVPPLGRDWRADDVQRILSYSSKQDRYSFLVSTVCALGAGVVCSYKSIQPCRH